MNVVYCRLDLSVLSSELVEIILRVIPHDDEARAYREYVGEGKPVEVLAEEDKFMLSVSHRRRSCADCVLHCYLLDVFKIMVGKFLYTSCRC